MQAVLYDPAHRFFGVIIFHRQGPDICTVVLLYNELLDPAGMKKADRKADLLSFEHPIDLHGDIHSKLFTYFSINMIQQLRTIFRHVPHLF